MRDWKLTPLLSILLVMGACAPKPAEQPTTDVAPAASTDAVSNAPSAPAVEAAPAPAPAPAPIPALKPRRSESSSTSASSKADTKAEVKNDTKAASVTPEHDATPTASLRDNTPAPAPAPAPRRPEPIVLPAGTELHVILSDALNSGKNKAGDEFTANLAAPVYANGATILERGAKLTGKVLAADGSGRVSGKASMTIALTGVTRNGKMIPISTRDLAAEAETSTGRDAKVIGGGAGVGAIIGAIAGGKKGAAVGAAVGGAGGTGAVLATKGKEVDYPTESKLTFALEKDLSVMP